MVFLFVVVSVLIGIFKFVRIVCVQVLDVVIVVFIKAPLHIDVILPLIVLIILFLFVVVWRSFYVSCIEQSSL